jgi:ABC-type transport system involved in cytochrome bd biosynthesis fused ATPase/permease subunit
MGRRANQMDVIFLYTELLKLMIEGKKQEKESRHEERLLQLEHMTEVVENYKGTANSLYTAGLISGIMGVSAGIVPILGFTSFGQSALDLIGEGFSSFKGLEAEEAFSNLGKILSSMERMNREMGEVRKTNADAHRYEDQQYGDMRRSDTEENTRAVDDIKQEFRSLYQTIVEMWRQQQELVSSLYK